MNAIILYRTSAEHFIITGWGLLAIVAVERAVRWWLARMARNAQRQARLDAETKGWCDGYSAATERWMTAVRAAKVQDQTSLTLDGRALTAHEFLAAMLTAYSEAPNAGGPRAAQ